MKEVWTSIHGYDKRYEVSTFGNVRDTESGNLLYQETHNKGYKRVYLMKNGRRKNCKVHRLVAEAFIPNPENKPQVNHRDFDTGNNRVWNLEWVTNEENARYTAMNSYSQFDESKLLQDDDLADHMNPPEGEENENNT